MARIAIAVPLLALSIGAFFPLAVVPVSSQAVVNARLSRVRSPLEGEIVKVSFETGDLVSAEQVIASVQGAKPLAPNDSEPLRAKRDLRMQEAELQGQLAAAEERMARYDELLRGYSSRVAVDLEMQLRDAERDRDSAEQTATRLAADLKRAETAQQERVLSVVMVGEVRDKATIGKRTAESKVAAVERLRSQLANVKSGFYLGGSVEQPRYVALREETEAQIGQVRQQKAALAEQIKQFDGELANQQPASRNTAVVRSPVNGIVWARSVASGQDVNEGEDLFRIADASSIHVDVWLDRRYGPQLSIGDTALIHLSGLGKQLVGRVTAFQGTSRRRLDEEINAIDLQPVHPDQYRVTIQLDAHERNASYIGQAAKVIFPGPSSSLKANFYLWLSRV